MSNNSSLTMAPPAQKLSVVSPDRAAPATFNANLNPFINIKSNLSSTPRVQLPPFSNLLHSISEVPNKSPSAFNWSVYGGSDTNYILNGDGRLSQQIPANCERAWLPLSQEVAFYKQLSYCLHENPVSHHLAYLSAKFQKILSNIEAYNTGKSGVLPTNKQDFVAILAEIPDPILNDIGTSTEALADLIRNLRARKIHHFHRPIVTQSLPVSPFSPDAIISHHTTGPVAVDNMAPDAEPLKNKEKLKNNIKMIAPKDMNSSLKQSQKRSQKIAGLSKYRAFAPKCKHCSSTATPEWRKGPDGARTLCNACGLFYSKIAVKYGPQDASKIMAYKVRFKLQTDRVVPTAFERDKMVRYADSHI